VDTNKLKSSVISSQQVTNMQNNIVALRLPPGSVIPPPPGETDEPDPPKLPLILPPNMDIVILEEEGAKELLTPYNWALIKAGSMDIEKYLFGLVATQ